MEKKDIGHILLVQGEIVKIEFLTGSPLPREILELVEHPEIKFEIYAALTKNIFFAICFGEIKNLYRGAVVRRTGKTFEIPVGRELLGRMVNVFGNPMDGLTKPDCKEKWSTHRPSLPYKDVSFRKEIVETGIKVIDFFTPVRKGEELGIFGGAGVGKTILLTELMRNITFSQKTTTIFAGIGERIREGHELFEILKEKNILPSTILIFGQMNEMASVRFKVGSTAATLAEYFRDVENEDVLFFVDNLYRFLQAGNELSSLLSLIPSEGGYQSTLASEIGELEERLVSTDRATITSMQAIYVPADDMTDPAVQAVVSYFDSFVVLSRDVYQEGRHPSVDILASSSSVIDPDILGKEHYDANINARQLLERYEELRKIVAIIGEAELSTENKISYKRARKLLSFMSQDLLMFGKDNNSMQYVKRERTVDGVKRILEGELDSVPEEELANIGDLSDLKIEND